MLGGVPDRPLEQLLDRLAAVVRLDVARDGAGFREPLSELAADGLPVAGDGGAVHDVDGSLLLEPGLGEPALDPRIAQRERQPEDVVAELADGAVPSRMGHPEMVRRDLAHHARGSGQDAVEPG